MVFFSRLNSLVEKFEKFMISWSIILMAAVAIANVIGRNLFSYSFTWAEEVTQFAIVWVTFIGASYAARLGVHIRMTAVFDVLAPSLKKILMIVITLCTSGLMFFLAWHGYKYALNLYTIKRHTLGLQIPLYWIMMWVPLGFVLTGIQYLQTGMLNLLKKEIYISPTLVDGLEEDPSRQFEI
jgi:TRAP-type C4-dicarboxylate transport system permease small subunit